MNERAGPDGRVAHARVTGVAPAAPVPPYGGGMAADWKPLESPDDSTEPYEGLTVEEAERRARLRGWTTVRTLPPDAVITLEYVVGRLNFTVRDGRVARCWKG
jgi:hypothetical protein